MNLATLIGPVDQFSATAIVAIVAGITVMVSIALARRRSRRSLDQEFELAKIKERDTQALSVKRLENEQAYKEKELASRHQLESERITQGLITSHARDVNL